MVIENFSRQDSLLTEYAAAQEAYLHYDSFSWQVGAVLIAGTFVFWGFLLDSIANSIVVETAILLVSILMSLWYLYTHHGRQIYYAKLFRIHEIERQLEMEQHLGWKTLGENGKAKYRGFGLHGHHLDFGIYFVAAIGSLIIGYMKGGLSSGLIVSVIIILAATIWVFCNELRMKAYMKSLETKNP